MVVQITDGRGSTKNISPEMHAEKRRGRKDAQNRARRAKAKSSGDRSSMNENSYVVGIRADKVNQFGVKLMDRLDGPMSSSSATANVQLRQALLVYIQAFTGQPETFKRWWDRHDEARESALEQIVDRSVKSYATGVLSEAFRATLYS